MKTFDNSNKHIWKEGGCAPETLRRKQTLASNTSTTQQTRRIGDELRRIGQ